MIIKCNFCGNDAVEELADNHFSCKKCGVGYREGIDGKPDIKNHLNQLQNLILATKLTRPELTNKEVSAIVQKMLHKIENHPLDEHSYCIYCNVSYEV